MTLIFRTTLIFALAVTMFTAAFSYGQPARSKREASSRKPIGTAAARFTVGNSALKIPLEIDNNIILMRVRVNNSKPLKFIFDTGASVSVIDSGRATELGLKARGRQRGSATGGAIEVSMITDVSLGVEGAEVSKQLIAAMPLPKPPGFEFDGVIGYDFIRQFVVEIDYRNKIMNLYQPETFVYKGAGEVVPLLLEGRRTPLARAKIFLAGRAAPVEARLEVDTGADGTFIINSPFVKRQRLLAAITENRESGRRGAGGEQKLVVGRAKTVQLGRFVINNPPIGLSMDIEGSGSSKENDGIIGGEIFRRFKVILDYSRRRMILEPNESFDEPYVDNESGDR